MRSDYTHVTFVIDRSGSMGFTRQDAQGGFNAMIEDLKALEGLVTVSLYDFNQLVHTVFEFTPVGEVSPYQMFPSGSTSLFNAAQFAIDRTGTLLNGMAEQNRPHQVKVVIITDGQENTSHLHYPHVTKEGLASSIAHQETVYHWEFAYLGSSLSTFDDGKDIGIQFTASYAPTGQGTRVAYGAMSAALSAAHTHGGTIADNWQQESK